MAIESPADRAALLASSDFGVSATYVLAGSTLSSAVQGIFLEPWATAFSGPGANTTRPAFVMAADDLPEEARDGDDGDTLTILGSSPGTDRVFAVRSIDRDGTGMVRLVLEEEDA